MIRVKKTNDSKFMRIPQVDAARVLIANTHSTKSKTKTGYWCNKEEERQDLYAVIFRMTDCWKDFLFIARKGYSSMQYNTYNTNIRGNKKRLVLLVLLDTALIIKIKYDLQEHINVITLGENLRNSSIDI